MEDAKVLLLKVINLEGLKNVILVDLLDKVIDAKLQELVDNTSTPFDNALKSMLMPELRKAAEKFLNDEIAKLQA